MCSFSIPWLGQQRASSRQMVRGGVGKDNFLQYSVSNASERKPPSDLGDKNDCHTQSSTSVVWLSIKQPRK